MRDNNNKEKIVENDMTHQYKINKKRKNKFLLAVASFLTICLALACFWLSNNIDRLNNNKPNTTLKENIVTNEQASKKDKKTDSNPLNDPKENNEDNIGDSEINESTDVDKTLKIDKKRNHIKDSDAISFDSKTVRENMENKDYKGKKLAFLTFDDGVNNTITPKILDVLKEKDIKATFFVVGKYIDDSTKDILLREYNEGHAIGLHSYSHDYEKLYPNRMADSDYIVSEYKRTLDKVQAYLGKDFNSKLWRYPGGHISWNKEALKVSDKALADLGVEWLDWNSMNGDAQIKYSDNPLEVLRPNTIEEAVNNFDKSLRFTANPNQVVVLMHDAVDKELTAQSLPYLIDHLREKGYEFGIVN